MHLLAQILWVALGAIVGAALANPGARAFSVLVGAVAAFAVTELLSLALKDECAE
jgi:hypothetical protein